MGRETHSREKGLGGKGHKRVLQRWSGGAHGERVATRGQSGKSKGEVKKKKRKQITQ